MTQDLPLFRDESFEYEDQSETNEDSDVNQKDFSDLFVVPTDWTVSVIHNEIAEYRIDLNPEYQRRSVWNNTLKSRFIESLILGVPIPQILLAESKSDDSRFVVLDGRQRLMTLSEFFGSAPRNLGSFRLEGLQVLKDLEGKDWSWIQDHAKYRRALENATIRTIVLRGWKREEVLYEIFYRLNSGSVKLSPMELRMALIRGQFLKDVISWTQSVGPLHRLLRLRQPDKRMADVELAVRYLAFNDENIEYQGNLKRLLDDFCRSQNKNYDWPQINEKLENLNASIEASMDVFGEKFSCRRWIPKEDRFDLRFNRAIFDIITGSFSDPDFRAWARKHSEECVFGFQDLFVKNPDFIRSVETTTKSKQATHTRFSAWYGRAFEMSGIEIPSPKIAP